MSATEILTIKDPAGRVLRAGWSRSRKSLYIDVSEQHPYNFAQVGLTPPQAKELASSLIEARPQRHQARDARGPTVDLIDPEDPRARLRAAWNTRGNWLTVVVTTWYVGGDPPEARLSIEQAEALARFLTTGPPP